MPELLRSRLRQRPLPSRRLKRRLEGLRFASTTPPAGSNGRKCALDFARVAPASVPDARRALGPLVARAAGGRLAFHPGLRLHALFFAQYPIASAFVGYILRSDVSRVSVGLANQPQEDSSVRPRASVVSSTATPGSSCGNRPRDSRGARRCTTRCRRAAVHAGSDPAGVTRRPDHGRFRSRVVPASCARPMNLSRDKLALHLSSRGEAANLSLRR